MNACKAFILRKPQSVADEQRGVEGTSGGGGGGETGRGGRAQCVRVEPEPSSARTGESGRVGLS